MHACNALTQATVLEGFGECSDRTAHFIVLNFVHTLQMTSNKFHMTIGAVLWLAGQLTGLSGC